MSVIQTCRRGLWLAAPLAAAGVVLLAGCSSPASGTQSTTSADAMRAVPARRAAAKPYCSTSEYTLSTLPSGSEKSK
jgi:hypothetical protein